MGSTKTFSQRIIQAVSPVMFGLLGILILIVFAWGIYELIFAWKPNWELIATFCSGYMAGWLIAGRPQRTDGMSRIQRAMEARGLIAAALILVAFGWRIYDLVIAWRPYAGNIATFCPGFVAGWLIALHARWEKGWRMNPRLTKVLRPIACGFSYVGKFIYFLVGCAFLLAFVVWIYGGFVSYWKAIAWCIGGICIGGPTLLVIATWFSARKDRMRKRA